MILTRTAEPEASSLENPDRYVCSLAAKALKISNALSLLGNTVRGVLAHLLRHAAVACVLPVAYYGSEAW